MAINYKQIESFLKLEEGTLSKAAEGEDVVDVDLSKVKVFTSEEFDTLKSNHATELKDKQVNSNKIGREEQLKELKNDFGLDFEGRRDPVKLASAFKEKMRKEIEIEPTKELTEALEKINARDKKIEQIEEAFGLKEKDYQSTIDGYKYNEAQSSINSEILQSYEDLKDKISLSQNDFVDLYKARRDIKQEDDEFKPYDRNGEKIKDDMSNHLSIKEDALNFGSGYVKKPEGGRAGEEGTQGSVRTVAKFREAFRRANPDANTIDENIAVNTAMQKGEIE